MPTSQVIASLLADKQVDDLVGLFVAEALTVASGWDPGATDRLGTPVGPGDIVDTSTRARGVVVPAPTRFTTCQGRTVTALQVIGLDGTWTRPWARNEFVRVLLARP